MLRLFFDVNNSGNRVEKIPKCHFNYVTILNNTRFDFTLLKGASSSILDVVGNCPAYTILTFPHDKLLDTVNFSWQGELAGGVSERAQVFFTEENLGLASQFRQPTIIPTATGRVVEPALNPFIINLAIPAANTEYSAALPVNCKRFSVSMRENDAIFRVAFEAGRVAAPTPPFLQVAGGGVYYEDSLITNVTMFIASPVAGKNMQIMAWS